MLNAYTRTGRGRRGRRHPHSSTTNSPSRLFANVQRGTLRGWSSLRLSPGANSSPPACSAPSPMTAATTRPMPRAASSPKRRWSRSTNSCSPIPPSAPTAEGRAFFSLTGDDGLVLAGRARRRHAGRRPGRRNAARQAVPGRRRRIGARLSLPQHRHRAGQPDHRRPLRSSRPRRRCAPRDRNHRPGQVLYDVRPWSGRPDPGFSRKGSSSAAGVGLRYQTGLGPIRLELRGADTPAERSPLQQFYVALDRHFDEIASSTPPAFRASWFPPWPGRDARRGALALTSAWSKTNCPAPNRDIRDLVHPGCALLHCDHSGLITVADNEGVWLRIVTRSSSWSRSALLVCSAGMQIGTLFGRCLIGVHADSPVADEACHGAGSRPSRFPRYRWPQSGQSRSSAGSASARRVFGLEFGARPAGPRCGSETGFS